MSEQTPRYSSTELGKDHPDFKASSWVQNVLSGSGVEILSELNRWDDEEVANSFFDYTLSKEDAMRARVLFQRPCNEPDCVSGWEICYFISVAWGIDGRTGRGHGGFTSLIMDHLTGTVAGRANPSGTGEPPATVTMTVDYKAPISTPCVILCRSWPTEISGRKVWQKGVIENEEGKPYGTAKALFINLKKPFERTKL